MNKPTKAKWEMELEDWSQGFGNMLGGFLGMFCVFAVVMFFYEGCSWRNANGPDNILNPEEEKETYIPSQHKFLHTAFDASDWILYK